MRLEEDFKNNVRNENPPRNTRQTGFRQGNAQGHWNKKRSFGSRNTRLNNLFFSTLRLNVRLQQLYEALEICHSVFGFCVEFALELCLNEVLSRTPVYKHLDTILDNLELETSHHLICHLETNSRYRGYAMPDGRDDHTTARAQGLVLTTSTTTLSLSVCWVDADDDGVELGTSWNYAGKLWRRIFLLWDDHIAVLLIHELGHLIRKPQKNICIILAPTVALVLQVHLGRENAAPILNDMVAADPSSTVLDFHSCPQGMHELGRFEYRGGNLVSSEALWAKCGKMDEATVVFDRMPRKDLVCWTTMIGGFAQGGQPMEAVDMYRQVLKAGMEGDGVHVHKLGFQNWVNLHKYIVRRLDFDQVLGTAVINMYSECGALSWACTLFDQINCKDSISWSAMITSFGIHGHGKEALSLFLEMTKTSQKPDHVTFSSLLSAFSHSGLVEDDLYGLITWLVNIRSLELKSIIWLQRRFLELNPDYLGIYSLVSNYYAKARNWDLRIYSLVSNYYAKARN
ncbi:putative pentatricopeptide repeat-containing protein [Quercus suber]|uniref:Pentatricopeptide repeat-containing protein n=1 Tax=Quercus suber TaxID=58331 RepID=A0AAW0KP96_QUESU